MVCASTVKDDGYFKQWWSSRRVDKVNCASVSLRSAVPRPISQKRARTSTEVPPSSKGAAIRASRATRHNLFSEFLACMCIPKHIFCEYTCSVTKVPESLFAIILVLSYMNPVQLVQRTYTPRHAKHACAVDPDACTCDNLHMHQLRDVSYFDASISYSLHHFPSVYATARYWRITVMSGIFLRQLLYTQHCSSSYPGRSGEMIICQMPYVSNGPLRQYLDRLSDSYLGTENGPGRSCAYDVSEPKARLYVFRPADSPRRIRAAAWTLCSMINTI